jgi:hypothetical protein
MAKRIHITGIFTLIALIQGCMYTDYGHYYVEPIADDPPIIVARTNLDTLSNPVVEDSLEVIYDIDIQNGELYYLDAQVIDRRVYDSDSTEGSFWLYPNDVQMPGIDTLKMIIIYSSNTNTLGDVLGVEALELHLKYAIDFKWTPQ